MQSPQQNRRSTLRGADEGQALETRRRLVEAYREAASQEVDGPSVTWLCARSGVGRSTFYTHFATVDDLAAFTLTEHLASLSVEDVARRSTHVQERREVARAGLSEVVRTFDQAKPLVDYAIRVGSRASVTSALVAQFTRLNHASMAAEYAHLDDDRLTLIAEFVSGGVVHVLLNWLEDSRHLDPAEVVEVMLDLLPVALTRTSGRSSVAKGDA